MPRQLDMVTPVQVRDAVASIEAEVSAGTLSREAADRRIAACRRAVTPRDLWKATGGRAGARRRQDWADRRRTAVVLVSLLVFCALLVWLVIWAISLDPGATS